MHPEIHGALVGGALGGAIAAATVVLDIRLRAGLDRKQRLEAAVSDLAGLNTRAGMALRKGDMEAFNEVHLLLNEKMSAVRQIAIRRRDRPIREACSDLSDMWTALVMRCTRGIAMTDADFLTIALPIRRMNVTLHGEVKRPSGGIGSERLGRYLEHGVDAPELEGSSADRS